MCGGRKRPQNSKVGAESAPKMSKVIIGGEMAENEKLPAVREVAKALTINPNTVQKTYRSSLPARPAS